MAFIFHRRGAASRRQRGAELEQVEASRLVGSARDRYSLPRSGERGGISALSVIVALLILIAVLGVMLASGI
ncbi:MAG TPA: hypothetical protein VGU20_19770 [Stellaceae bacterium]|nr:hypothetical protein [Stellaceae bacterium]